MGIFNFLKIKEEKKTDNRFVGRHEQFYYFNQFLGQKSSPMDLQIAINRDTSEHSEVLNELKEIEDFIRSEEFIHQLAVLEAHERMLKLVKKANDYCVLWNDQNIKNRCQKIETDIFTYVKNLRERQGNLDDKSIKDINTIIPLENIAGFFCYSTLGGILKKEPEQMAWLIFSELFYNSGLFCWRFTMPLLSPKDAEELANKFKTMNKHFLDKGLINDSQFKMVNGLIEAGIKKSEESYKSK